MAILGVPSTSIVDSTSVGRSLITASDAAAARVIMELAAVDDVTFNSVSSVDGSFSGTLDTEVGGSNRLFNLGSDADVAAGNTEYLETSFDTNVATIAAKSTGTGVDRGLTLESAGTSKLIGTYARIYAGVNLSINCFGTTTQFGSNLQPSSDNTRFCGIEGNRWSSVASYDGSFSGTLDTEVGGSYRLFNLGSDADVAAGNTEYLEIYASANVFNIAQKSTGTGVDRQLTVGSTTDTGRTVVAGTTVRFYNGNSLIQSVQAGYSTFYENGIRPTADGVQTCGMDVLRWATVYGVDGSFSGNLNVEDGGAFQFYGLGTEGDTNTEYLRFDTVGNDFELATVATGTGSAGSLYIGAGGSSNVMFRSDHTRIFQYLRPQTTNTVDMGTDALRFRKSYFTDGDFSGDIIVAANVDFTGLPTSDPVVAGRIWNDSGTMKISAG